MREKVCLSVYRSLLKVTHDGQQKAGHTKRTTQSSTERDTEAAILDAILVILINRELIDLISGSIDQWLFFAKN